MARNRVRIQATRALLEREAIHFEAFLVFTRGFRRTGLSGGVADLRYVLQERGTMAFLRPSLARQAEQFHSSKHQGCYLAEH
jgi:hypothetical protein